MKKLNIDKSFNVLLKKYGIYVIFLVLVILCTILSPAFLTVKNVTSVLRQISITGILAFAEMLLIICGFIDLSLGAVVALSGMVSVNTYLATGSYGLTFLTAIAIGVICCTCSGILVAKVKLPAFIATMAMDSIVRGACYMYTNGQPIYKIGDYGKISSGYVGPVPIPVIFLLAVAFAVWVLLSKTTFGRNIYATGGNKDAANASGINVQRTTIIVYAIAGALTGVAAVLQIARVNSGLPDTAMNYHGDAIASAVIGGTSFTGGIGSAPGTLVGSIIMGIISNILNLTGVQSYVQNVVKGLIIIGAVALDLIGKNRRIRKKSVNA